MTPAEAKVRGAATAADAERISNLVEAIRLVAKLASETPYPPLTAFPAIEEVATIVIEVAGRIIDAHEADAHEADQ